VNSACVVQNNDPNFLRLIRALGVACAFGGTGCDRETHVMFDVGLRTDRSRMDSWTERST